MAGVVIVPPTGNLVGRLDEQRGEFAGLDAGEAVVAEVDARRLVHAAAVDTSDFAQQHPVRLGASFCQVVRLDAGRVRNVGEIIRESQNSVVGIYVEIGDEDDD